MYWDIGDSPTVYLNQRRSLTTICCQPQKEEEENAFSSPASSKCEKGRHTTFFAPPMETETRQCRMEKSKDSGFKDSFWWIWIYWDRNCQKKESDWERAKKPLLHFPTHLLSFALLCPLFFCLIPPTNPSLSGKRPLFVFPPPVAKRYLLRWNHCLIFRQFCVIFCCNLMQFSRSRQNFAFSLWSPWANRSFQARQRAKRKEKERLALFPLSIAISLGSKQSVAARALLLARA